MAGNKKDDDDDDMKLLLSIFNTDSTKEKQPQVIDTHKDKEKIKKPYPPCSAIFDRLWYCGSPRGQFTHIYRYGDAEDCTRFLYDWQTCMKAKVYTDVNKKEEVLDSLSIMQPQHKPNDIWEMKVVPSWKE